MKQTVLAVFFLLASQLKAQHFSIHGTVMDEKDSLLAYATVALMNPGDSTLAFYGIK